MKSCFLALATMFVMQMAMASSFEKVSEKIIFNGEKIFEYRLSNGLRILVLPRHQAKVLSYGIWFKVGSVDEKLDPKLKKTGLAHLFEHMMFRGTTKYPDPMFTELTSRMGAEGQNATTYYYRTNYFESIPSVELEKLMELESDRMRNLKIIKEGFEKEKGAVVGELRRHLDNPGSVAHDELMALAFEKAPFHWNVIGSEDEIRGFTLDEANYFYRTFYAPNNATIIAVGDIEPEKLVKLTVKYYGSMPAQELPTIAMPVEPEQEKERRKEVRHPQATSELLMMAYRIPPITSDEVVPLSLLSTHLSTGMEARLRKLLVDTGIAVSASGGPSSQPDVYLFSVRLTENRHADQALRVIDKELGSLQKAPISKEAFERALNQELLSLYSDISENASLGSFLGENLMLSGNYLRGFEIIESYRKTTSLDIQKAAAKYLRPENRSIVVVKPQGKTKRASQPPKGDKAP